MSTVPFPLIGAEHGFSLVEIEGEPILTDDNEHTPPPPSEIMPEESGIAEIVDSISSRGVRGLFIRDRSLSGSSSGRLVIDEDMGGLGSDVEEDSLDVSSRQDVTMETETSAVEPVINLTENMRQGAAMETETPAVEPVTVLTENMRQGAAMETEAPAVEPVSDLTENMNTNATEPAEDRVRMPENIDVSTENAIVSPLVEDVISENVSVNN